MASGAAHRSIRAVSAAAGPGGASFSDSDSVPASPLRGVNSAAGTWDLELDLEAQGSIDVLNLSESLDIYSMPIDGLRAAAKGVLASFVPDASNAAATDAQRTRSIFCSRTLNLRSIKAIGYDMDYTLIHYDVNAWEGLAYEVALQNLRQQGIPGARTLRGVTGVTC
jgi:hypothetical protein